MRFRSGERHRILLQGICQGFQEQPLLFRHSCAFPDIHGSHDIKCPVFKKDRYLQDVIRIPAASGGEIVARTFSFPVCFFCLLEPLLREYDPRLARERGDECPRFKEFFLHHHYSLDR